MIAKKTALIAATLAVVATGIAAASAVLSRAEYCSETGARLTNEQQVDMAVRTVLASYPPPVLRRRWVETSNGRVLQELAPGENSKFHSLDTPERPISYRGHEEFRQHNPDCCRVVAMLSPEAGPPSQLSKVFGGPVAYVELTYLVRYLNERDAGVAVRYQESVGIGACGQAVKFAGKLL